MPHEPLSSPNLLRLGMFLQDPALQELHDDYLFSLEEDYISGASSSRFVIQDTTVNGVQRFSDLAFDQAADLSFAHFQRRGLIDNPHFHQVNLFAILHKTLALVEEELGHPVVWGDQGPLVVRPHAFEGPNAFYTRHSLNFGHFISPFRRTPVWTCLSHDIVAHELGHAVLDALRPDFLFAPHLDVGGFHESFSDLLSMFSAFEHPAVVKHVFASTGGDLHHPSLLSSLGEEFGIGLFGAGRPYLRSALVGPAYSLCAPSGPHARSTIWTAAMYDILDRLIRTAHPAGFTSDEVGLANFTAAMVKGVDWVKGMLFRCLHYTPPAGVSMPMLARLLYRADAHVFHEDALFREIAKEAFMDRKLWDEELDLSVPLLEGDLRTLVGAPMPTLARFVVENADALGVPLGAGVRLLAPRLVTTTRHIDNVTVGETKVVSSITEHYFEYRYELIEYWQDPESGESFPITIYGGGTLVLDEVWNPKLLTTFPERRIGDPPGVEGVLAAWNRTFETLESCLNGGIAGLSTHRRQDRHEVSEVRHLHAPLQLEANEQGLYRFVHPVCSLEERLRTTNALTQSRVRPMQH